MQRFHFRTRKQDLNSVEGSKSPLVPCPTAFSGSETKCLPLLPTGSRANITYVDALLKYHKQKGHHLNRMPFVDKRPLDLYRLKKAVESRGGFDKVCRAKKWAEIGRDLGYSGKIMSSLSTSLKNSYQKWLCPYEDFLRVAKPGVHQQLEWENGGPLTPSPAPSPMKHSSINTPSRADSPARHASSALQASVTSERDTPTADAQTPVPTSQPVSTGGFKAINSGGFTAVNSGFTSVNRPIASEPPQASTPTKSFGTPMTSAKNTPEYRPSSLGPANGLKRQMSHDSLDSSRENGVDVDDDGGSRRSKRLKKGTSVPTSSLGPFTHPHPLPENPTVCCHVKVNHGGNKWIHGREGKKTTTKKHRMHLAFMLDSFTACQRTFAGGKACLEIKPALRSQWKHWAGAGLGLAAVWAESCSILYDRAFRDAFPLAGGSRCCGSLLEENRWANATLTCRSGADSCWLPHVHVSADAPIAPR